MKKSRDLTGPGSGAPAELRELGVCPAAFEQLWLAAPFSDFQAVADLCPRFLDFLQWGRFTRQGMAVGGRSPGLS